MSYEFAPASVIRLKFTTVDSTGLPATLTSGAIVVYKDDSTTPSSAGVTLTPDFASVTGANHVAINTGADPVFYAFGSQYFAQVSAGTIGGVSAIGYKAGEFRLVETTIDDLKLDHVQQTAQLTAIGVDVTAIRANTDNLPSAIKRNTARPNFEFFMASSSDHVSGATGLTVAAQRSIDGGPFASTVNTPTEVGNGVYAIDLDAADLNGEVVTLLLTAAGADPRVFTIVTEP